MQKVLTYLKAFWDWLPLKFFWILLLSMWIAQDRFYPFSHYPMYSSLSEEATYYYITNGEDEPIPSADVFYMRTSNLKKAYKSRLKTLAKEADIDDDDAPLDMREEAGRQILARLVNYEKMDKTRDKLPPVLRLKEVTIKRGKKGMDETLREVGEVQLSDVIAEANAGGDQ